MKNILVFLSIISILIFIIFFNCQQPERDNKNGNNDDNYEKSSSSLNVSKIAAGGFHTVALLNNGTIKCCGYNNFGQLGYGDTAARGDDPGEMGNNLPTVDLGTGRRAVQIAAGQNHTVVLLDNGTVKCWGLNLAGQLGYGDINDRGDNAGEMGDNLPIVNLGTGRTAKQIAAGGYHTIVLLDNNTVKCWGNNESGQLGYEDTNNRGDNINEMGDNFLFVDLGAGRTATQISAGATHTAVLLDNDTIKCWGGNDSGQLGFWDTNNRGDNSGEMGNILLPVNLGTGRSSILIYAGSYHTAVILDNDTVKCWGLNVYGQLGYGDPFNRGDNPNQMGDNLPTVSLW